MFFVIVALGSTDLLFALDSIPAIYGLTQEPYLVFTANVFALMGLRQLYFLIGGLLRSSSTSRSACRSSSPSSASSSSSTPCTSTTWADWAPFGGEIPIWLSLTVIIVTLAITTVASLIKSRRDPAEPTEPLTEQDAAERPAGIADRGTPPAAS